MSHFRSHVTPAVAEPPRRPSCAIEPPQPWQSDGSRVTAEEEWRVRRTGYGWEHTGDRVERAFRAKLRQGGKGTVIHGAAEDIRTRSIGEENDDGQGSIGLAVESGVAFARAARLS
jgi:hypothetical protein